MSTGFPSQGVVVRLNEPLAAHTASRTGGCCDAWIVVHRCEQFLAALAGCRAQGWTWRLLGAGTRTLVRDGGVRGAVISLGTDFCGVERRDDVWVIGAATPMPALMCVIREQTGVLPLKLQSTPGSVGAAVVLDRELDGLWKQAIVWMRFLSRGRVVTGSFDEFMACKRRALLEIGMDLRALKEPARLVDASHSSPWFRGRAGSSVRAELRRAGMGEARLRRVAMLKQAPELLVNLGGATARDFDLLHRSVLERCKASGGVELHAQTQWLGQAGSRV